MATGSELPIIYRGADGAATTTGSPALSGGFAASHCRLVCVWLDTTAATFTSTPTGWQKLVDQAIGTMRCGVFFTDRNDPSSTATVTFTASASSNWAANGAGWDGIHGASPLALTPVVASGAAASTLTIGGMTLPANTLPLWFWAARYTAGASSRVLTVDASTISSGNIVATGAAGILARCGSWITTGGGAGARGVVHPAGSTGTKSATVDSTASMAAWGGIGLALRAADVGGQFAMAA